VLRYLGPGVQQELGGVDDAGDIAPVADFSRYQDLTARWTVEGNDGWRLDEEAAPCARWWETMVAG
jgi:hypothetical protein